MPCTTRTACSMMFTSPRCTTQLYRTVPYNAQVGAFPFTTLSPHLGTLPFDDGMSLTVADIPGLIEGAHANR